MFRGMLGRTVPREQGKRTDLTSGQIARKSSPMQELSRQLGVDETTLRRDIKFAEAVEVLGMEEDVASVDGLDHATFESSKPNVDSNGKRIKVIHPTNVSCSLFFEHGQSHRHTLNE